MIMMVLIIYRTKSRLSSAHRWRFDQRTLIAQVTICWLRRTAQWFPDEFCSASLWLNRRRFIHLIQNTERERRMFNIFQWYKPEEEVHHQEFVQWGDSLGMAAERLCRRLTVWRSPDWFEGLQTRICSNNEQQSSLDVEWLVDATDSNDNRSSSVDEAFDLHREKVNEWSSTVSTEMSSEEHWHCPSIDGSTLHRTSISNRANIDVCAKDQCWNHNK